MKHKLFGIGFSLLILFSSIVSLMPSPQKAAAASYTGKYTDANHITLSNGITYINCSVDKSCSALSALTSVDPNANGGQYPLTHPFSGDTTDVSQSNYNISPNPGIYWAPSTSQHTHPTSQPANCPVLASPSTNYVGETFLDVGGSLATFNTITPNGSGDTGTSCINGKSPPSQGSSITITNKPSATATVTGSYVNANTIQLDAGQAYDSNGVFDDNHPDSILDYYLGGNGDATGGSCPDRIHSSGSYSGNIFNTYSLQRNPDTSLAAGTQCTSASGYETIATAKIGGVNNGVNLGSAAFQWQTPTTITNAFDGTQTYTYDPVTRSFIDQSCGASIAITSTPATSSPSYDTTKAATGTFTASGSCNLPSGFSNPVYIAPINAAANSTGNLGAGTVCADGSTPPCAYTNTSNIQCTIAFFNPLHWLICPAVALINTTMNYVGRVINSYLTVPGSFFDNSQDPGKEIYIAWTSMRDIALVLLVIFALIMVLSQALSFGPFDAYTVKKLLPRILVGIILVTLSWPLLGAMVAISNGVGEGVRQLIATPFNNIPNSNIGGDAGGLALLGAGGIASTLGVLGAFSFGLSAIIALFTGLFIIILRQMAVIFLAIFAPVAIICYALPGTEKVWKVWWDSFFGALLLFPIIEGLIAIGAAFGKISSYSSAGGSVVSQIIGFIATYIPYFLLPFTVRFAGGALRNAGGVIHAKSQGIHGGLQKYRQNQRAIVGQKNKSFSRLSDRNMLTRGINRTLGGITAGPKGWVPTNRSRAARSTNRTLGKMDTEKNNSAFITSMNDDSTLSQLATHRSGKEATRAAEERHAARQAAGTSAAESAVTLQKDMQAIGRAENIGFNNQNRAAAFDQLGRMGRGFENSTNAQRAASSIAGGDTGLQNTMMEDFMFNSKGAGRFDLSRPKNAAAPTHEQMWDKWNNASLYEHANAKPANIQAFNDHFEQELGSADPLRRQRALQYYADLGAMQSNAKGGVSEEVNSALDTTASHRVSALRGIADTAGPEHVKIIRDPTITQQDPTTREFFHPEVARRQENAAERIDRYSRKYERPDPHNL